MLTKNDLILLLDELSEQGVETSSYLLKLATSDKIPLDVLKFVNDRRQLDVASFYQLLRKNYNSKRSPLYKNIVKEDFDDPNDVLTTLAALNLQILLFARKLSDPKNFLKQSRGDEITKVLNTYYTTYDLIPCLKMLRLIKADLKSFEYLSR